MEMSGWRCTNCDSRDRDKQQIACIEHNHLLWLADTKLTTIPIFNTLKCQLCKFQRPQASSVRLYLLPFIYTQCFVINAKLSSEMTVSLTAYLITADNRSVCVFFFFSFQNKCDFVIFLYSCQNRLHIFFSNA